MSCDVISCKSTEGRVATDIQSCCDYQHLIHCSEICSVRDTSSVYGRNKPVQVLGSLFSVLLSIIYHGSQYRFKSKWICSVFDIHFKVWLFQRFSFIMNKNEFGFIYPTLSPQSPRCCFCKRCKKNLISLQNLSMQFKAELHCTQHFPYQPSSEISKFTTSSHLRLIPNVSDLDQRIPLYPLGIILLHAVTCCGLGY